MKPYEMKIYVYAKDPAEVEKCQQAVYDFVNRQRERGKAVTAAKITDALTRFGNNPIIANFL